MLAASSTQVSPSGGSGAFAGGNVAVHLPTKKSRRGIRRRRTYQDAASSNCYPSEWDDAGSHPDMREDAGSEKRGVVTVNDLFNLGMPGTPANCHTPSHNITSTEVSQIDCAWANAPSPISPCCAVRTGPSSSSGIVSTNPLTPSYPPPAAPEASTRIAYKAPSSWRSVTQAAPPQLDSCAFEVPRAGAETAVTNQSPCKGLATPLGIVSTTPMSNKLADASARTPPGARGTGPFLGSPMATAAVRPVQAAMSIGAVTLASSPQHMVGQSLSPNSNLSTSASASSGPVPTPVGAGAGCSAEDAVRSWFAQGGLPCSGADLAAQLMAAAPEVYED